MLRNYAEFLNLDSETVLLQFAEGLQRRRLEHLAATESARPSVSSTVRAPNRLSVLLRRWMTPDLLVGGFLFLILFSVCHLGNRSRFRYSGFRRSKQHPPQSPNFC